MDTTKDVEVRVPMTALYVVLAVLGLGVLALIWRELPAIIRYVKSEMM